MGQLGRLLLAQRGLALAARPGETGGTQLLLVGAQLTLQAEGHLLVTGTQLLLTPAPFVSCGVQEGGAQCPSILEAEPGLGLGSLEGTSEGSAALPSSLDSSCVTLGMYQDLPCAFIYLFIPSMNI